MEHAPNNEASRVERLEEAQMFADRRADLLSEQVLALEQKLREVAERIRRVEDNLGRLDDAVNSPQPSDPTTDLSDDLP